MIISRNLGNRLKSRGVESAAVTTNGTQLLQEESKQ